MFRKILIIILIVFIIIIIGLLILAFSISRNSNGEVTVQDSFKELVSFGDNASKDFTNRFNDTLNRSTDFIGQDDAPNTQDDTDVSALLLRKITTFPVAGAIAKKDKNEKTIVKFIARENGHIFEVPSDSNSSERVSNTTILRIWDALWLSSGEEFIARFIDEDETAIESFYAKIIPKEERDNDNALSGSFLQKNIKEITYAKDRNKIFYIVPNGSGSIGIISNPDGSNKVQIFDSPISEWKAQWAEKDTIAFTTKTSSDIQGYLYFLDIKTEKLTSILAGVDGLTTLINNNANKVLFTRNDTDKLLLSVFDIKKNEVIDLPLWALTEKCVWSEENSSIIYCGVSSFIPRGDDLDAWYKGLISFSDSVWMIDIETQTAKILVNPVDIVGEEIDLIKPILSSDENYLLFVNKKDSTLWQLKLK
jgi:hypothetical protein